jgi:hypothetical protein
VKTLALSLAFLAILILGFVAMGQMMKGDEAICMAGKITAPCDSWMLKGYPDWAKITIKKEEK